MPRKVQFSREMIIDAAIEMIRAQGGESINARDLGLRIGCSSRPLFTAFKNMNELIDVVRKEASERFLRYMKVAEETDNGEPVSKRMGMRIVQFAYEEPNLYKFIHWSGSSMPDVATLSEIIAAQYMRDTTRFPEPLMQGKKAVFISTCTTPWPFNILMNQSRGAIRALREIGHYSGWKIVATIERGGVQRHSQLTSKDICQCNKAFHKLCDTTI